MEDVNWFFLFEEDKVVLLNCFVLIAARLWCDLCSRYFHTYDPPRNVFRNQCQGIPRLSNWFLLCFRNAEKTLPPYTSFRKVAATWGPEEATLKSALAHK